MKGMLTPEQQLKVLARVWGYDRTGFVFLPHIDGQAKDKDARRRGFHENRAFKWPREEDKILAHIKAHPQDDLYFTPALFKGKRRITQHLLPERSLWADLDPVDPEGLGEYRPTIAWESSPGKYQGIWLLNEPLEGASKGGRENHRLTAYINADPSGWDSTQLLRVPGRPNFKPEYTPEGEPNGVVSKGLLWDSGPRYVWSDFEDLPEVGSQVVDEVELVDEDVIDRVDRHEVWGRLRLKVSRRVREYMALKTEPPAGNRNEVLWQIERELADAGASLVEIVAIVRASVWNKYRGRHDEMKRLKIEAAKAIAARDESPAVEEIEDEVKPDLNWLSSVVQQPIPRPRWLVRNMWTRGGCGFISGAPKSYKSWMALDMAVTVATGTTFLGQPAYKVARPEKVLYLQEEDDLLLVMERLSLIAEAKVPDQFWQGQLDIDDEGTVWWMGPTRDIPIALQVQTGFIASDPGWQAWLDEVVDEHGFSMVLIDTLSTTAGDIDTDRASELMNQMLKPLKVIAKKNDTAIVIVHHNKKSATDARGARAGNDMLGSVALHAWVDCAIYARGKDSSGTIQIERESKMAQDESLKITVPYMFENLTTGARQLWQPELSFNVGQEQQQEKQPTASSKAAGKGMANKVKQLGPGPHTVENLARVLDMSVSAVRKQCESAVANGFLFEVDGGYTSREP